MNSNYGVMATGGFVEGILKSFSSNVPPDFYVLPNTVSNIVSDFTGGAINLGKEMKKLIISNQNEIKK